MSNTQVVPNVMLIGAQKSGTTSLWNWASQHPNILGPEIVKDYPFFVRDDLYHKGINHYSKFYDKYNGEDIVLGGNVNIMHFQGAVKRVHKLDKNMKLIMILRNPVDRACSHYRFNRQKRLENRSLGAALNDELGNASPEKDYHEQAYFDYVSHGYYSRELQFILNYFPKDHVFIRTFDQLVKSPETLISELFSFLDVSPYSSINYDRHNETKGGYRSKALNTFLYGQKWRNKAFGSFIRRSIPIQLRHRITKYLVKINLSEAKGVDISTKDKQRLVDIYKKEVEELQDMLDLDLSSWTA